MKVTAKAQRSGDWWAIEVPEVEGVFTQAKRLEHVAAMARDAVATMLEVDPSTIEVEELQVELPSAAQAASGEATAAAARAAAATLAASKAMRKAVRALRVDAGLSSRDAAKLLGISHQRISQLEKAVKDRPDRAALEAVEAALKAPKTDFAHGYVVKQYDPRKSDAARGSRAKAGKR